MKLKLNLLFLSIFLQNVSFSSSTTKFTPQNSTKNLSQKLQRFAIIQKDSKETQISLFSRPFLNFLFIKKSDSTPFLRIRNFDESCLDSSEMEKRNIQIEFLFISGSKIVIKNEYGNFKNFQILTNCGEYGPMNVFQKIWNEVKLNQWFSLMNFCSKQYKKFDEIYESVEIKIQSNIKCGFFMNLGEDSYISEIPNSNVFHPSKSSLIFNSNSEVPDTFKDFVKFNEKLNEVEMDLKKVLPEKLGFIEEKFFEIPSFRFDFDKNCNEILVFLQFYDNQKCMVTVSLDSGNNFILETSFGTISISKNDLLKTKFFADSSMIYSITEFDSYLMPKFESIILCEIYSTEILPYFKITNTKSNSKCLKSKIIFGGSLTNEKMSLFVSEKEKKFSSWLEALPYIGVLCGLLFIGTASFFVYCCIRNHRKKKNKTLKEKQKLLAKLPTAKDEKDLEPNTLSEIIDKEIEGKEIQQKPKTFKVIVPAVEKNISNNKSCLGERE